MFDPRALLLLTACSGLAAPTEAQPVGWLPAGIPPSLADHAAATDTVRGRMVVCGGFDQDATWEWDGARWLEHRPAVRPPSRVGGALAFDALRRRTVLFGGQDGAAGLLGDTWEWDGGRWELRATTGPAPRQEHALAYDVARGRIVLFGGQQGLGVLGDTWEWDGTQWTPVNAAGAPTARRGHAMAYDPQRQRVVLCGGWQVPDGVWDFDGLVWTNRGPGPARAFAPMVWDGARLALVLFGGLDTGGRSRGETLIWTGAAWVTGPAGPAARYAHAAAAHPQTTRATIFGGKGVPTSLAPAEGDLWELASAWARVHAPVGPTPRSFLRAAGWDARGSVFACGNDANTSRFVAWEWDGQGWQARAGGPPTRVGHGLAYDAGRDEFVMFGGTAGGYIDDTWTFAGGTWRAHNPTPRPTPRSGAALAFDSARGRTVLFGGFESSSRVTDDTWEWDGAVWQQRTPARRPPPRGEAAMAFDRARGRVVLFGGRTPSADLNDTWVWDGLDWAPAAPFILPPRRYGAALQFMADRQRVVLIGGWTLSGAYMHDAWEWDGTNWVPPGTAWPASLIAPSFIAADARGMLVAFDRLSGATWLGGALQPAARDAFGTACGGVSIAASNPRLGTPALAIDVRDAAPLAPTLMGFAPTAVAAPVGGGCTLYLEPTGLVVALPMTPNALGFASIRLMVPYAPALRGSSVFAQAFLLDPQGPFQGLSLSDGMRLRLGD